MRWYTHDVIALTFKNSKFASYRSTYRKERSGVVVVVDVVESKGHHCHQDTQENNMIEVAALLLCKIGGKSGSTDEIKAVLEAAGLAVDEEQLTKLSGDLEGKDLNELLAAGAEKIKDVPFGGGGGGGGVGGGGGSGGGDAGGAAAEGAKVEEKEEEEEMDLGGGMDMFGGDEGGGGGGDY